MVLSPQTIEPPLPAPAGISIGRKARTTGRHPGAMAGASSRLRRFAQFKADAQARLMVSASMAGWIHEQWML
jgi:hypothetical protein